MAKKSLSVNKAVEGKVSKTKKTGRSASAQKTLKIPQLNLADSIARVRNLAWTGQHAQAIELATQALAYSKIKPTEPTDLLDLRAESYIAQGKLDLAKKDANAMLKIANASKKAALKAQALIRKGVVQGFQDEYETSLRTLTSALKIARRYSAKHLEAESLYRLGELQLYLNRNEQAVHFAQQAADLYMSLGDPSRLGRSLRVVAFACFRLGRREESINVSQTALTLCEKAGDNLGKGLALNALSVNEIDLALALKHVKEARRALEASGYLNALFSNTNNLGYTYSQFGLYQRAVRFYKKAIDIYPYDIGYPIINLAFADLELNDPDLARKHLDELAERRPSIGDEYLLACIQEILGQIALAEVDPKTATKHFKRAVQISHQAGLAREIGDHALLGQAYLAEGNKTAAIKSTTRATKLHRDRGFPKVEDYPTQRVWWSHAQALQANKKTKEAREALEMAYDFLLEGIVHTSDEGIRRNYLNKIKVNREIIQAWLKDGAKRKLPNERLFAH
ncbi:MAG: tetratricopeptide repeat protein, partial [Anaerolineales bacterium]